MLTEEQLKKGFVLGDCEILHDKGVIRRDGQEIRPEPLVWRVLLSIARRNGDLVSKEEIVADAWGGRAVADDPINRAIAGVRQALGDKARPHEYLETLQRRGYRLLKPVELTEVPVADPTASELSPDSGTGSSGWRFVALLLAVAIVAITVLLWPTGPGVNSIAVMPFENHTGTRNNDYIASGFKDVLVRSLGGIEGVTVKNARLNYEQEDDQISELLDVDSVLRASLTRAGEVLTLNYTISRLGQGVVFSGKVEGGLSEQFSLQELLAVMVRRDLVGKSEQTLFKSRSSDSSAYDSYMRGAYLLELRGVAGNLEQAIELFQEAIRLDQSFGPSYLALATAYALLPDYRNQPTQELNSLALATVEQGIAADPTIEEAAASIYGFVYHKEKRWRASEDAHVRAINAEVVDSNAFNWYSRMLASVGRLDASLELALEAVKFDPSSALMNSRAAMAYTWLEDSENAHKYFLRAERLGADGVTYKLAYAFLLTRDGQWQKARALTHEVVRLAETSDDWVDPVYDGLRDSQHAATALLALDKVEQAGELPYQVSLVARTMLGDVEGAMRVAQMLKLPGEVFEMDLLFVPEMKPLRQHPGFMPLLRQLGIVAYWASQECSWAGEQVRCAGD
ncbi:MAG: winged helix-turn-helix domain-containing protein [Gammaproteobacteria bacterium]|nr:winged helix-turn-helix domain-containing protein [Gammaproteobacteria bacterium]